ncbi:MAG: hypothetical protein QNJ45_02145 [Ardenticatenaceae bacterium]|nr:hypothetical protein [Ardenticatenaceae bacterium]
MQVEQDTAAKLFKVSVYGFIPVSTLFLCILIGWLTQNVGTDEDAWLFVVLTIYLVALYLLGLYLTRTFYLTSKNKWRQDEYRPWRISVIFNLVSLPLWLWAFIGSLIDPLPGQLIILLISGILIVTHSTLLWHSVKRL